MSWVSARRKKNIYIVVEMKEKNEVRNCRVERLYRTESINLLPRVLLRTGDLRQFRGGISFNHAFEQQAVLSEILKKVSPQNPAAQESAPETNFASSLHRAKLCHAVHVFQVRAGSPVIIRCERVNQYDVVSDRVLRKNARMTGPLHTTETAV